MKIIEFIGTSGSGKTLALRILVDYLKIKDISYEKRDEDFKISIFKKIIFLLRFILKNIPLTYLVLKNILLRKDRMFLLKRFFKIFYLYEYSKSKKMVLFDEGFLLRGLYFHVNFKNKNGFNKKVFKKYIKKIPKPDYLFYIDTDIHIAKERMIKRGIGHSVENHNETEVENFYENTKRYFDFVATEMEKSGVKVIKINNNNKFKELKKEMKKNFRKIS